MVFVNAERQLPVRGYLLEPIVMPPTTFANARLLLLRVLDWTRDLIVMLLTMFASALHPLLVAQECQQENIVMLLRTLALACVNVPHPSQLAHRLRHVIK